MSSNNQRPPIERQSYDQAAAEASTRSLTFDPNVRARFIREMLNTIPHWIAQGLTDEQIREKVPEFAEKYPELFSKIIQKEDLSPIQSMLAMLDRMGEGNITQHQASIIIGKKLVDKFVNPQINGAARK
jgi:hemerythrin-like domain-containing protein